MQVILAESCPLTRAVLTRFLQEVGIDAKPAAVAREATDLLTQNLDDTLLIVDLESIVSGGLQLVQTARRTLTNHKLKILGITFTGPQQQLSTLIKSGLDSVLLREELNRTTFVPRVQSLLKTFVATDKPAITETTASLLSKLRDSNEIPQPIPAADIDPAVVFVASARTIRPIAHEVIRLTVDDRSDLSDLVQEIRKDPSLTAKLVGASNMAIYRRAGGEVRSLQDAVSIIGVKGVQELTLSLEMSDDINDSNLDPVLRLPKLWGHSLATAHLAEYIATSSGTCDAGKAYVAGMLHDYGRRLMTWQLPNHYKYVLTSPEHAHLPLLERERQIVGIDHAILGARVMDRWHCPAFLARAISLHHSAAVWDQISYDEFAELSRVIHVADALAIAFGYEADNTDELPRIPHAWLNGAFANAEEDSRRMSGSLQERISILMSRTNYPIDFPHAWAGRLQQIVMFGTRAMPLEPLQATLLRGYPHAKVVTPSKSDLTQPASLAVLDWRGMDASESIGSVAWLSDRRDISHWPLLIVSPPEGLKLEPLRLPNTRIATITGLITPKRLQQTIEQIAEVSTSSIAA